MKTVSYTQLVDSYKELFPEEIQGAQISEDTERGLGRWLSAYPVAPSILLSASKWYGKATKALFHALGLALPESKLQMYNSLQ